MPSNRPPRFLQPILGDLAEDDPARSLLNGSFLAYATDADPGDVLRLATVRGLMEGPIAGRFGTLAFDLGTGAFTYTLDPGLRALQGLGAGVVATESFTFTVADGAGATAASRLLLSITGANDAPTARARTHSVSEDNGAAVAGNFLRGAADADRGDVLRLAGVAGGAVPAEVAGRFGRLVWDAAGNYSYALDTQAAQVLAGSQVAEEVFAFTLTDDRGGFASETLTIRVVGRNDAPILANSRAGIALSDPAGAITLDLLEGARDPEGHALSLASLGTRAVPGTVSGQYGRISWDHSGQATYRPDPASPALVALGEGAVLEERFAFSVADAQGARSRAELVIAITGANDAASIGGDLAARFTEGAALEGRGRATIRDPDAGEARFAPFPGASTSQVTTPEGTLTLDLATGDWVFHRSDISLRAGESREARFTLASLDGSATAELVLTIDGVNDAPSRAFDTAILVSQGQVVAPPPFNPLMDVFDPEGDAVTLVGLGALDAPGSLATAHGTLTWRPDGRVTFLPDMALPAVRGLLPGQSLTETVTVRVADPAGLEGSFAQRIIITGGNGAPQSLPLPAFTLRADAGPLALPLAQFVTDPEGGPVTLVRLMDLTAPGTTRIGPAVLNWAPDGGITLTPDPFAFAAAGPAPGQVSHFLLSFTYADPLGATTSPALFLRAEGTALPPLSPALRLSLREDAAGPAGPLDPLAAAFDPDGETFTLSGLGSLAAPGRVQGLYGEMEWGTDGLLRYLPDATRPAMAALREGQVAEEVFSIQATDSAGLSGRWDVVVAVTGVNTAPSLADRRITVSDREGLPTPAVLALAGVTDPDSTGVSLVSVGGAAGPGVIAGRFGALTWRPDGTLAYQVDVNAAATRGLAQGEVGLDAFPILVRDSGGATRTAAFEVAVTGSNDTPSPVFLSANLAEDDPARNSVVINPLAGVLDVEGDALELVFVSPVINPYGVFERLPDGRFRFTLDNASPATQALGTGGFATVTVNFGFTDDGITVVPGTLNLFIQGANDAPRASPILLAVTEGAAAPTPPVLLAPQVTDPEGGPLTILSLGGLTAPGSAQGVYGRLVWDAQSRFSYVLDNASPATRALGQGDVGLDAFPLLVADLEGLRASTEVQVRVTGVNNAPILPDIIFTLAEDDPARGFISTRPAAAAFDPEGDVVSLVSVAGLGLPGSRSLTYGTATWSADGRVTYALDNARPATQGLAAGRSVDEAIHYMATDGSGLAVPGRLILRIEGDNDAPVAGTLAITVPADATGLSTPLPFTSAAIDPDGDSLTLLSLGGLVGAGQFDTPLGTVFLDAAGSVSFQPAAGDATLLALREGEFLTAEASYSVRDPSGLGAQGRLVLTVQGVNDAPVVAAPLLQSVREGILQPLLTLQASDPEGMPLTYALADDFGRFTLTPQGSLLVTTALDFETRRQYDLIARVGDGVMTTEVPIRVEVLDVDEPPVFPAPLVFALSESARVGTSIGFLQAADPDAGDSVTYAPLPWDAPVRVNPVTGELTLNRPLDFETQPEILFDVTASSAPFVLAAQVRLEVLDTREPFGPLRSVTLPEIAPAGGTPPSWDFNDLSGVLVPGFTRWSLAGGAPHFTINPLTGVVSFTPPPAGAGLDFETNPVIDMRVTATDGGRTLSQPFAVLVQNSVEPLAYATAPGTLTVSEALQAGRAFGQVTLFNPEGGALPQGLALRAEDGGPASFGFTFASQQQVGTSVQGRPLIHVTYDLVPLAPLDFETKPSHALIFTSSQGELPLTIEVLNAAEAPQITGPARVTAWPSAPPGSVVATVSASDPDTPGMPVLDTRIMGGEGRFAWNGTTGQVTITAPLDPARSFYNLTFLASDGIFVESFDMRVDVLPFSSFDASAAPFEALLGL